jgi:hypothetical protein
MCGHTLPGLLCLQERQTPSGPYPCLERLQESIVPECHKTHPETRTRYGCMLLPDMELLNHDTHSSTSNPGSPTPLKQAATSQSRTLSQIHARTRYGLRNQLQSLETDAPIIEANLASSDKELLSLSGSKCARLDNRSFSVTTPLIIGPARKPSSLLKTPWTKETLAPQSLCRP